MVSTIGPLQGGALESIGGAAVLAASLLLVLAFVAMAGYAYRHVRGDGIEWPDDEADETDGVSRSDDDEWKYS